MGDEHIPVKSPDVYKDSPFAPLYDLSSARDALGFVADYDQRALLVVSDIGA